MVFEKAKSGLSKKIGWMRDDPSLVRDFQLDVDVSERLGKSVGKGWGWQLGVDWAKYKRYFDCCRRCASQIEGGIRSSGKMGMTGRYNKNKIAYVDDS